MLSALGPVTSTLARSRRSGSVPSFSSRVIVPLRSAPGEAHVVALDVLRTILVGERLLEQPEPELEDEDAPHGLVDAVLAHLAVVDGCEQTAA